MPAEIKQSSYFVFDDNGQSIILFWKCILSGEGGGMFKQLHS